MRIEDTRYISTEALVFPLSPTDTLPFEVGMVHVETEPIELSICVDFCDVKYVRRGYDANGKNDNLTTLVCIDMETITITEPYESVWKAFMEYKKTWEKS